MKHITKILFLGLLIIGMACNPNSPSKPAKNEKPENISDTKDKEPPENIPNTKDKAPENISNPKDKAPGPQKTELSFLKPRPSTL